MFTDFLIVAGQVVTLFIMMGVGFFLARRGWFTDTTVSQATHLLLYVVCPCIIIEQMQIEASMHVIQIMVTTALAMSLQYILMIPVSQLMFRKTPADRQVVYRFGMIYANNSFMGLPLLSGVLGESAILFGVVSMAVFSLFQWTHGITIMGGKPSVKRMLINPGILGLAAGLFFFLSGIHLPATVNNAVAFFGDMNTPLAMVVIGAQMSRTSVLSVFRKPQLYLTAAMQLIVMPTVLSLILLPMHLEPLSYCACVVLAACPTAGITAMFAQQFNRDVETAAQMVTLSTLLSIVTLPVFAVAAKTLAGIV